MIEIVMAERGGAVRTYIHSVFLYLYAVHSRHYTVTVSD